MLGSMFYSLSLSVVMLSGVEASLPSSRIHGYHSAAKSTQFGLRRTISPIFFARVQPLS